MKRVTKDWLVVDQVENQAAPAKSYAKNIFGNKGSRVSKGSVTTEKVIQPNPINSLHYVKGNQEKRNSIEEEFFKVINSGSNDRNTYTFEGA